MLDSRRLTHSVLLVGEDGLGAGFAARCGASIPDWLAQRCAARFVVVEYTSDAALGQFSGSVQFQTHSQALAEP